MSKYSSFDENAVSYQKLLISIRYWLLGASEFDRSYLVAVKALEYGIKIHTGLRKDGITPEFYHQLSIAQHARTMIKELMHPASTLASVFLHDTSEDYDVGHEEIESRFGSEVAIAVKLLTKKFRGNKIPIETYFAQIAENPIASVVKGLDRINNVQTMPCVFSVEKQINYLDEVKNHFLPMLKTARRNFPEQESVYLSIKQMLMSQIYLIDLIHKAAK